MKKIAVLILGLFFVITPQIFGNSTRLEKKDMGSNQVELSVQQEEHGYLTSIRVCIQIEGHVSLEKMIWSEEINADYYKKYTYDASKKEVTIYVIAPGRKNLVTAQGNIPLGTLCFTPDTNKEVYRLLVSEDITAVNSSYEKLVLNIAPDTAQEFVATKSNTNTEDTDDMKDQTQKEENSNNSNQQNNNNNNTNNTTTNNSTNTTSNENTNNDVENKEEDLNQENTENKDVDNTNDTQNKQEVEKEYQEKLEEENKKQKENEKSNIILYVTIGVVIVVIIGIGFMVIKNKKKY